MSKTMEGRGNKNMFEGIIKYDNPLVNIFTGEKLLPFLIVTLVEAFN